MRNRNIFTVLGVVIVLIIVAVLSRVRRSPVLEMPPQSVDTTIPSDTHTDWQTYSNAEYGLAIKYPQSFSVVSGQITVPYEYDAFKNIPALIRLKSPDHWQPSTNLSQAGVDVLASRDVAVVAGCLAPLRPQYTDAHEQKQIAGVGFEKFTSSDAGAGNYYDTTSYRTVRGDVCIVLDENIHSTNIDNYDPSQGIKEFDESAVVGVLDEIVGTLVLK